MFVCCIKSLTSLSHNLAHHVAPAVEALLPLVSRLWVCGAIHAISADRTVILQSVHMTAL